MSSLGDVLELLFARPDPALAVHAVAYERRDHEVARRVSERFWERRTDTKMPPFVKLLALPAIAATVPGVVADKVRRGRSGPAPVPESQLTVWLDPSGRARVERAWEGPGGPERRTAVVNAGRPDPDDPTFGAVFSATRGPTWPTPTANDVERLFVHRQLREVVACLELEPVADGQVAGRPVVVVRAARRPGDQLWPHWLPFGADGYELRFDREYGSLLAFRGFDGDEAYEEVTVTEVTYGGDIDAALLAGDGGRG